MTKKHPYLQPRHSDPVHIDSYGASRQGEARDQNADQYLVAEVKRAASIQHASASQLDDSRRFGSSQAHVLLVADGVSGQPGARQASRLAVDEVMESILNAVPWAPELDLDSEADLRRELKETIARCDESVRKHDRATSGSPRSATTLTMAFVRWPHAFIVHAGDSRAYHVRGDRIDKLTNDHTMAQRLVDKGTLEADEAESSRFGHMLWNAVGGDESVSPELTSVRLRPGDALLLCSDGVTSHVSEDAIASVISSSDSAEEVCDELMRRVDHASGRDDATVAYARFQDHVVQAAPARRPAPRNARPARLKEPRKTPPPVPVAAASAAIPPMPWC